MRHLITQDLVDALLTSPGHGHAVLKHGPGADLLGRFQDNTFRGHTVSRFCDLADLHSTAYKAVTVGNNIKTVDTRITFATRTGGVIELDKSFQGVVRTVDLAPGEFPTFLTVNPQLGTIV